MRKLFMGSDHAGLSLRQHLRSHIATKFPTLELADVGTDDKSSCHYPEYAERIAQQIGPHDRAILVCGSGIGIGVAAVKCGLTCATVWNEYMAEECAKECQAIALGERAVSIQTAELIVESFLAGWLKT